jgi:hypothetical protein
VVSASGRCHWAFVSRPPEIVGVESPSGETYLPFDTWPPNKAMFGFTAQVNSESPDPGAGSKLCE